MDRLAAVARVTSVDWPGFGELGRPDIRWSPDSLSSFLDRLLRIVVPEARIIVAAGHSAAYALYYAAHHPGRLDRLALIAPTWRRALPTMGGGDRPLFAKIRRAIELPIVGPGLYRANVNPFVVRIMVAGHVYSNPRTLSGEKLSQKQRVIDAPGARFGSAAFGTGGLDRVSGRSRVPRPGSRSECAHHGCVWRSDAGEVACRNGGVRSDPWRRVLHAAKRELAVHEEFPDEVARVLKPFIS
jgi:pimeloyl-ACP methyl ester carboxylesterase